MRWPTKPWVIALPGIIAFVLFVATLWPAVSTVLRGIGV